MQLNIAQLMLQRLGGRAEYADRVTIGPIELIVRDVDDSGKIASVGLSFEPTPRITSIPAFLSPAELADRVRALVRRLRRSPPPDKPEETVGPEDARRPDAYNSRGN